MSGYLMFNESSGGTLILHWSEEPIEGAIAMFRPGKTVPKFKFTANGGRSEIVRDCAGVKIKKLYEGYAQFIKAAKSFEGVFTMLSQLPDAIVAVSFIDTQQAVVPVELATPMELKDMVAVAVMNEAAEGVKGCLKMETSVFQQAGAKFGAGLML